MLYGKSRACLQRTSPGGTNAFEPCRLLPATVKRVISSSLARTFCRAHLHIAAVASSSLRPIATEMRRGGAPGAAEWPACTSASAVALLITIPSGGADMAGKQAARAPQQLYCDATVERDLACG